MNEIVLILRTDANNVYMDSGTVAIWFSFPKLDSGELLPWANNHAAGTGDDEETKR